MDYGIESHAADLDAFVDSADSIASSSSACRWRRNALAWAATTAGACRAGARRWARRLARPGRAKIQAFTSEATPLDSVETS